MQSAGHEMPAGVDVTHLDDHMGALSLRPEFFDVKLELAVDFGLPVRMPPASVERLAGFPFRRLAAEEGVVFPDHILGYAPGGSAPAIEALVAGLRPGVTELVLHPAQDTPELRAFATDWSNRVDDLRHATAAGEAAQTTVLASFTFGTDRMDNWPAISRTAAHQGAFYRQPDGVFVRQSEGEAGY